MAVARACSDSSASTHSCGAGPQTAVSLQHDVLYVEQTFLARSWAAYAIGLGKGHMVAKPSGQEQITP